MVDTLVKKLTKAEFWAIADAADITYELIDGVAVAKHHLNIFTLE